MLCLIQIVGVINKLALSVKSQPHKWHIWFFPTQKANAQKTKRAIFSNARQKITEK
jgi:hypothetical protein